MPVLSGNLNTRIFIYIKKDWLLLKRLDIFIRYSRVLLTPNYFSSVVQKNALLDLFHNLGSIIRYFWISCPKASFSIYPIIFLRCQIEKFWLEMSITKRKEGIVANRWDIFLFSSFRPATGNWSCVFLFFAEMHEMCSPLWSSAAGLWCTWCWEKR